MADSPTTHSGISIEDRSPDRFRVGTLRYTSRGLVLLFFWLLWGDFCFQLMEIIIPQILPLKLHALGSPNFALSFIVSTIPGVMNFTINPVVGFRSDRFRSTWGRRIPFIAAATPFLVLCLVVMGFSQDFGGFLHRHIVGHVTDLSAPAVTIILIGVIMVCFQFFNMIVSPTFWFLFRDVVPAGFVARFMALFRVVGALSGATFNYLLFRYATTHMREIFIGVGLLYGIVFLIMVTQVKEGEYPPPPPNRGDRRGLWAAAKTYAAECFTHRFYWLFFLQNLFWSLASACGVYVVFVSLSLGLSLQQIGNIAAVASLATAVLAYPAGVLADRIHPLRVMLWAKVLILMLHPVGLIWLFTQFSPTVNFWIVACYTATMIPLRVMFNAVSFPMAVRLLPGERFGQFLSANNMITAVAAICGGLLAGIFMDLMRTVFPDNIYGKDYCYRLGEVWSITFLSIALVFLAMLYRQWKLLGGDASFIPPEAGEAGATHPHKSSTFKPQSSPA